jgi:C4-dicarboxylate transporter, DctM subunit
MSWEIIAITAFALILIMLFMEIPVAICLGLTGMVVAGIFLGKLGIIQYTFWQVCNSFILTAIPLFVFMGQLLLHGGVSKRLYDGSASLVGRLPGGLLHSNIVACAIFAALSGSSTATAAAIGTIAIPELERRGYDNKMIMGSLAGGGTLGILIPPSIPMIVYGAMVEESIGSLFVAGIIPGIMLAIIFMLFIYFRVLFKKSLMVPVETIPFKQRITNIVGMWPVVLIIVLIIGGIYFGILTPTEAAAVGAAISLILTVFYRTLTLPLLKQCLMNSVTTTTMIMFIIISANMVAGTLGMLRVPTHMSAWVINLGLSRWGVMVVLIIMYLFLGCFLDGISMMVLTLPVVFPIIVALGFDPIWFGIVLVILIEMAAITPPVGLNLYTIHGLVPKGSLSDVILGSMPYFTCMMILLIILSIYPSIATWLPMTMK